MDAPVVAETLKPATPPRRSPLAVRLERATGNRAVATAIEAIDAVTPPRDGRIGVVADTDGACIEAVLQHAQANHNHHLATSRQEQEAAQAVGHRLSRYDEVHWDALKLPNLPDPKSCAFDALICGAAVGCLDFDELFAWARTAVVPGGSIGLIVETFIGNPRWRSRYTKARRLRARVIDASPDLEDQVFPTRDELIEGLQAAGFERILLRGLHRPRRIAQTEFVLISAR